MSENRNVVLAIGLSLAILFGFQYFYEGSKPKPVIVVKDPTPQASATASSQATPDVLVPAQILTREQALAQHKRVLIKTPKLTGSINLVGARLDDLGLNLYRESADPKSPAITLLSPEQSKGAYFVEFGWLGTAKFPDAKSIWTVQGQQSELTPTQPLTLTWKNDEGLKFERTISVDENYLFTVTDRVISNAAAGIQLKAFSQTTRVGKPVTSGYYILHEGAIGIINSKLNEVDYDKLIKEKAIQQTTTGGWLGFTDKYWLVALIPNQKTVAHTTFSGQEKDALFQCRIEYDGQTLKPGQTLEQTQYAFAGAKVLSLLDGYEAKLGFNRFDLAVDFGWFYFLTKPLFYVLEFFHQLLGNLGLAILFLTVLVKVLFFPLANKSFKSMARMKILGPKMELIKQRYANDKVRMNQELMDFYRREKVNPVSGCLPMLIQAPIFFCLYKVFFVTIEMRHAPFYGWIHDLSAPDPTSVFNLFGLIPWTPPSMLMIGLWPLLMGATMVLQQRLNPQPADPVQAKMMLLMPVMFTYLFASFPAGLVIYWAWSNLLTIAQQMFITRRAEQQSLVEVIPPKRKAPKSKL
ncbi:membrane protein insertase YidC [Candidatus Finniella inopinata]|uniref:Membrane protein insertase YidC n=1 Tax=Candidatus Finniella inopinata TaxID=1696036 RepID=A0A4Q7DIN0_9PROT|nr:membrane protein insertase YidC [Candidatus Finniella inopinata]RZI46210.1 membrane protein insertase YidC [Candidatus Finniella inopinata]